jgi:ATP-dependent Lon protease
LTSEPDTSTEATFEAPAILADDAILFPEMEVSMTLHDPKSVAATAQAFREHSLVVMVPSPSLDGIVGSIGTLVMLRKANPAQGSGMSVWKGLWRVKVEGVVGKDPYVRVRFAKAGFTEDVEPDSSGLMKTVFEQIDEFIKVIPGIPAEIIAFLKSVNTPGKLADLCAYSPFFSRQERLDLLKTLDPVVRLGKVHKLFEKQLNDMKRLAKATTILECATCAELADKAFEVGGGPEVARAFLEHVSKEHPEELLGLIAERYGSDFMRRRALR